jgi:Type III restriction enzyme, res subunit
VSPELRPYQQCLLERIANATDKRILIVCPTGGGKTVVAAALMASGSRRALMVAHRREIVNQTSAKLAAFGVHHGVIQAGDDDKLRPMAAVQVSSIQTLHGRSIRSAIMPMPLADLVVIDEAHHACAMRYRKETPLADSKEATLDYKRWDGTPFNGNQAWRGRGQKPKKQNPGGETTSRVGAKQPPVLGRNNPHPIIEVGAKQRPYPHLRVGRNNVHI